MRTYHVRQFSRRKFLGGVTLAGAVGLLGWHPRRAAAEPPPETTKVRLVKIPAMCMAPEYLAEELLRLEGFTEVEYVEMERGGSQVMLVANRADVTTATPYDGLPQLDAGQPFVLLAGLHGGCYELFAHKRIGALRDLKGKRVAVSVMGSPEYYYIASMLAYVGMDPRKDIDWVFGETSDGTIRLFMDGQADAFLAFPPQPHELRAKQIGRVILNTGQDRPWEQYFCCMIA